MTDLKKLKVSLTKHGAHKIALLLKEYSADEILKHLWGDVEGVKIDEAQAKKNLSVNTAGKVPSLWNEARKLGDDAIDALVLIAIIFSHIDLIKIMKQNYDNNNFKGIVNRNQFSNEKAFTNFACAIDELGYLAEHRVNYVRYDLQNIFRLHGINELVRKLLALKLRTAGWDQKNSFFEESALLGLHKVFSLSKEKFESWLTTGRFDDISVELDNHKDENFFFEINDDTHDGEFIFRPGHNAKTTGEITVGTSKKERKAILLHNKIQNLLYEKLVHEYDKKNVGTEIPTGNGTSIDVVVKTNEFCWFYEIKTACSVKACIRQAIPQLLEYAYWHGKDDKADRLIIVSPKKITAQAKIYLDFLRKKFKLPLYYEQFELSQDKLI